MEKLQPRARRKQEEMEVYRSSKGGGGERPRASGKSGELRTLVERMHMLQWI